MKKLLNIDEAAELLKLKKATLYDWTHRKKIPFVKLGGRVTFIEDQLLDFVMSKNIIPKELKEVS